MQFPYKRIGSSHERPFVPIKLRHPKTGSSVECYALVNSGSDVNLFSPVLGEIIGLDVQSGVERPIHGVVAGERRSYFEHDLELVVGGWVFPAKVGFMPALTSQAGEGVVGQNGFFDRFTFVKFSKGKGAVELGQLLLSPRRN